MEWDIHDLMRAGIATDLLTFEPQEGELVAGVRLRPIRKDLPRNKMVLACGPTFEEALHDAISKAHGGRWETLDWAARPWTVPERRGGGNYGL